MGLLDAAFKLLLRVRPTDLLGLVPGVTPGRPLRLLDKEFAPAPALPRALDGCVELADEAAGTVFHVEFEAEPRSDTGLRVFQHCALAHLGLAGRPVRPVVFYLTPGTEGRRPQDRYSWEADGRVVLELRFEAVRMWDLGPAELLARPCPALWAAVALCAGVTLADVGRARTQIEAAVTEAELRRELTAVTYTLARRRFAGEDLLRWFSRELLMDADIYKIMGDLWPERIEKGRQEGREEGRKEGREEGLRAACRSLLEAKAELHSATDLARLDAMTAEQLERLVVELGTAQDAEAARAALARASGRP